MKLKVKLGVMILTLCFVLTSCGESKEYYENTVLEGFETFTSVTGIELTSSQESEENILYNYILDDNATGIGAITKWQQYVKEYGFTYMESFSAEDMEVYTKDEYILCMFLTQPTDATVQYVVSVPIDSIKEQYPDEEVTEENKEEVGDQDDDYAKLVELTTSGDYQGAMEFYGNSSLCNTFEGYSDSKTYFFYAQAMLDYQNGIYGDAYDTLAEYCQGFLDADIIRQEIDNEIVFLDGVYVNKSVDYEMHVIINHGSVAMEFESDKFKDGATYLNSLCSYTFTTGEETFAVCDATSEISYILTAISENGDSFLMGAAEGKEYSTFSGVYERTSLEIPPRD